MKRKILVVEDEPSIADTIVYALRSDGFEVTHVLTASEALETDNLSQASLAVLDITLPDMNGFDLCREIRKRSSLPIIFLTARAEEVDRILGLELGADDYMTKPFSPRELVARVKTVLRRAANEPVPQTSQKNSKFSIDSDRLVISFEGRPLDLSRYEFRILSILIRRPGKVFSREALMDLAWEEPDMSLARTVDTHIKTLRAKLREMTAEDPIITHRGFGYSLKEH